MLANADKLFRCKLMALIRISSATSANICPLMLTLLYKGGEQQQFNSW